MAEVSFNNHVFVLVTGTGRQQCLMGLRRSGGLSDQRASLAVEGAI